MNFFEYCESESLNITSLSRKSIQILGSSYLESNNPTQDKIDMLARIDSGELTSQEYYDIQFKKIMDGDI